MLPEPVCFEEAAGDVAGEVVKAPDASSEVLGPAVGGVGPVEASQHVSVPLLQRASLGDALAEDGGRLLPIAMVGACMRGLLLALSGSR